MIVTEDVLSRFRDKGEVLSRFRDKGKVPVRSLPSSLFSQTGDLLFKNDAAPLSQFPSEVREVIHVVPVLAFLQTVPPLSDEREWIALHHQCGGYHCLEVAMVATILTPNVTIKDKLDQIGKQFYFAQHGNLEPGNMLASSISAYSTALSAIGLDCECTWRRLSEGLYPIDCTQENLNKVASDAPSLDMLADWRGFTRARYSTDPIILLLASNSD
ncbi:hypothetical protein ELI13_04590 [Rhizobium ruizarguesonis]|jgi:hypothetical protein|uniref:hypothetical protein n=1 Tax=Rhizobium ruizarguesonis TaxID=2081791 RepID=UPI00102F305D|nr:hypothetical protein [Rhizobium ruizarguesonis]TCA29156.1 hypothetical protein E0H70_18735 [Rhizobium leguminosarum bv. viciae]NEI08007.1 hypothetical protein [Rhizobium ruizarguesonis]TAT82808.1 hypothetical protein ELI52_04560 [Rhizobium ruizarguesonis]TAU25637.1 hypothetical protein ELI48_05290 [Rhizobium ruizarguesonis]TAU30391.1 hypothetical protein ELI47_04470 [Rhizobium ruizarguesonis]